MEHSVSRSAGVSPLRGHTVQGYLDETSLWADGTTAPASPLTDMQRRIWWLSVAGKFFEGLVVFMRRAGVAAGSGSGSRETTLSRTPPPAPAAL